VSSALAWLRIQNGLDGGLSSHTALRHAAVLPAGHSTWSLAVAWSVWSVLRTALSPFSVQCRWPSTMLSPARGRALQTKRHGSAARVRSRCFCSRCLGKFASTANGVSWSVMLARAWLPLATLFVGGVSERGLCRVQFKQSTLRRVPRLTWECIARCRSATVLFSAQSSMSWITGCCNAHVSRSTCF